MLAAYHQMPLGSGQALVRPKPHRKGVAVGQWRPRPQHGRLVETGLSYDDGTGFTIVCQEGS